VSLIRTLLIRVSGPDQLGVSAELFEVLSAIGAVVKDIEQIVVRRRLTLDVLIEVDKSDDALKDLLLFGYQRGLHIDVEEVDGEPTEYTEQCVVTLIGRDITPSQLMLATRAISNNEGNIDRIIRLSRYPVMSYELAVNGGKLDEIKQGLLQVASETPELDIAVQPLNLSRKAKRLVVLDVDSTLIQNEVIDLLAEQAGCGAEVSRITELAMRGEIDFEDSLLQRVSLLEGLDELGVERAWQNLKLTPGARTFCRTLGRLGFTTALVSGGFSIFAKRLQRELNIKHARANELEIVGGRLTGKVVGPIVTREAKADFLCEIAEIEGVPIDQTVAVGDGANDLDMLTIAGLGIAFNAKPIVQDAANTTLRVPYLDAILFMLGVSREEIEAADSSDLL
jgi:phosphoserine phosphatase